MKKSQLIEDMYFCIWNSFSNKHSIKERDGDFIVSNKSGDFLLKAFHEESIKGSSGEVLNALEHIILTNQAEGLATSFLFLRCISDYEKRRNSGAFLKQSWDVDKNTGQRDFRGVKKITNMEKAVELFYNAGVNQEGYKSRLVYYNHKTGKFEAVRFRENSSQHRISNTLGYACDWDCMRGLYLPTEQIDHQRCKTELNCTIYARGRNKREVRIAELGSPLRMEKYQHNNLQLAKIKG